MGVKCTWPPQRQASPVPQRHMENSTGLPVLLRASRMAVKRSMMGSPAWQLQLSYLRGSAALHAEARRRVWCMQAARGRLLAVLAWLARAVR